MGRHSTAITPKAPTPPPSSPPSSPPKKRKRDKTETAQIEVDVTAPEPPSKKALRKAKKAAQPKVQSSTDTVKTSEDHVEKERSPPAQEPTKRSEYGVWIGNLAWTTTKDELRTLFQSKMKVKSSEITRLHMPAPSKASKANSMQKIKPQNRGFAYVDFASKSALEKALSLSEELFCGRKVLIKNAKSFEGRPDPSEVKLTSGHPPNRRVFMGNLHFNTTKEDLQRHFKLCGPIENVHVATFEDSGKCKGYAWVEFQELAAAEAAVRGWIEVKRDEPSGDGDELNLDKENTANGSSSDKMSKLKKRGIKKLFNRELKVEFAEGKDVRYKKRFGKDSALRKGKLDGQPVEGEEAAAGLVDDSSKPPGDRDRRSRNKAKDKIDARSIKPGAALASAPRLTGSIVESQGTKIHLS